MSAKLKIIGLEGASSAMVVEAQFNPKEINIDKAVPWQRQKMGGAADLEFTSGEPMTMDVELLFDGFETGTSVQPQIEKLNLLSDRDAGLKRPPKVKVLWGSEGGPGTLPAFQAVIETLSVRYTMFDSNGIPVRATVRLRFRQARNIKVVAPAKARQGTRTPSR